MIFMGEESILGLMVNGTRGNGISIRCTARDILSFQMLENTSDNTKMKRSMGREDSCGQMEEFTMVDGRMASKTELEFTLAAGAKLQKDSGSLGNANTGLTR